MPEYIGHSQIRLRMSNMGSRRPCGRTIVRSRIADKLYGDRVAGAIDQLHVVEPQLRLVRCSTDARMVFTAWK